MFGDGEAEVADEAVGAAGKEGNVVRVEEGGELEQRLLGHVGGDDEGEAAEEGDVLLDDGLGILVHGGAVHELVELVEEVGGGLGPRLAQAGEVEEEVVAEIGRLHLVAIDDRERADACTIRFFDFE